MTSLSVAVGIGVSSFGLYQALAEVSRKNQELRREAMVRSQQIFLNQVLDWMSAIKSIRTKEDPKGNVLESSSERYGDVTWVGTYAAAKARRMESSLMTCFIPSSFRLT